MTYRSASNKVIVYLILIAFTTGCTSMGTLPTTDAQSLLSQIEAGDTIKVVRNDTTEVTFKVTNVSDDGISGDGVFVAVSDIRQVQIRQFSTGKTAGLVAAIVGVLAILASSVTTGVSY